MCSPLSKGRLFLSAELRLVLIGEKSVLVPLTNSLYVRGELANSDAVLVDVGTGFLVEKARLCLPLLAFVRC